MNGKREGRGGGRERTVDYERWFFPSRDGVTYAEAFGCGRAQSVIVKLVVQEVSIADDDRITPSTCTPLPGGSNARRRSIGIVDARRITYLLCRSGPGQH